MSHTADTTSTLEGRVKDKEKKNPVNNASVLIRSSNIFQSMK